MSSTQSQGTGIAFRTPQPEQYHKTVSRPVVPETVFLRPSWTSRPGLLKRFSEQFDLEEIGISQEEIDGAQGAG